MLDDDSQLVPESRIVRHEVRDGRGQDVAVAVFVLQAFAVERGEPSGAAQQEAERLHVAGRPGQGDDALDPATRVVVSERANDEGVGGVSSGHRPPRSTYAVCVVTEQT